MPQIKFVIKSARQSRVDNATVHIGDSNVTANQSSSNAQRSGYDLTLTSLNNNLCFRNNSLVFLKTSEHKKKHCTVCTNNSKLQLAVKPFT